MQFCIIFHYLFIHKIIKSAKKLLIFGKINFRRLSNFLQIHIFETLIIFLETAIKLITGIFDLQK